MEVDKDLFFLSHIIDSITKIEQMTANSSFDKFNSDWHIQDAVVRNLEIIGEAANQIPDDLKGNYTLIAWNDARSMRNFLIHEYFSVDLIAVWNTIKEDLPIFRDQIQQVITALKS
jgi:uncharacterized protein with HEPN domain